MANTLRRVRAVVCEGYRGAARGHLLQHWGQHLPHGRGQDLPGQVHDVLGYAATNQELGSLVREVVAVVLKQIIPEN